MRPDGYLSAREAMEIGILEVLDDIEHLDFAPDCDVCNYMGWGTSEAEWIAIHKPPCGCPQKQILVCDSCAHYDKWHCWLCLTTILRPPHILGRL